MKRIVLIALLLLLATVAYGQNRMSGVRYAAAPAVTDFTADIDCQGAWMIFTDGTKASAEADQCPEGGTDNMVQNGGTFTAGTPPAGTTSGQDSVDMSLGNDTCFVLDDSGGAADEFENVDFTAGCWLLNDSGGGNTFVISKDDITNWEMVVTGAERHQAEVSATFEQSAASTNVEGTWEHFVMRYEGSAGNEIEIFQNATDVCEGGCATDLVGPGGTTADLVLGATQSGCTSTAGFDGELMECWYVDRILTDTEIAEIFLCGFDGTADGATRDSTFGGATCGDITTCC